MMAGEMAAWDRMGSDLAPAMQSVSEILQIPDTFMVIPPVFTQNECPAMSLRLDKNECPPLLEERLGIFLEMNCIISTTFLPSPLQRGNASPQKRGPSG